MGCGAVTGGEYWFSEANTVEVSAPQEKRQRTPEEKAAHLKRKSSAPQEKKQRTPGQKAAHLRRKGSAPQEKRQRTLREKAAHPK